MRAFIIGTGPSLNITPMHRLRGEFTLAVNRFDLLGVDWDPTWWILADVNHGDGFWNWPALLKRKSQFVFRETDRPLITSYHEIDTDRIIFMRRCEHIGGDYVPDAWHLPSPCDYGGGVSIALQAAAALGKNPIYLVGCDLYKYRGPDDVDINHFHPEYCRYKRRKSTGAEVNTPEAWEQLNERMVHSHEIARDSARCMGIDIYNATCGGNLEVYERRDIFEVLDA